MAAAVDAVEGEGPGEEELEGALDGQGQGAEGGGHRGRLDLPAQQGRGQVRRRENVQAAAEDAAGNTVPDGATEPRLRRVVDLQMGGDGALAALGGQDRVRVGLGYLIR